MENKGTTVINLWLDDRRKPPEGWLWVTTIEAAKTFLKNGDVIKASLDHDLGACPECMKGRTVDEWLEENEYQSMPHCSHVGTGYDLVSWMERNNIWPREKPQVHSTNAIGSARMKFLINKRFKLE